jgi:hypothetical protein
MYIPYTYMLGYGVEERALGGSLLFAVGNIGYEAHVKRCVDDLMLVWRAHVEVGSQLITCLSALL